MFRMPYNLCACFNSNGGGVYADTDKKWLFINAMNTKSSVYPAVVVTCLLGFAALLLGWLQFNVSLEINPDISSLPETVPQLESSPSVPLSTIPSSQTVKKPIESVKQDPLISSPELAITTGQGALRMRNQTEQPIRVALLERGKATSSSSNNAPIHWDFAPGEGSRQGLILSLPKGNLKLKKGDILVAFAIDGSRRYWGPYVVGETPVPIWNQKTSEWQLVLQPDS